MIEVRGLHKSFGAHKVLQGIDLKVEEGSTAVILGGSGSGKTVLMKHMIGLLKPDHGEVRIEGENIVPLDPLELERVRRKFGMVFQAAALFDSMNVYENVSFALREHTNKSEAEMREIVRQKLDIVGLRNVEEKFPADLSGGMRKRVGLARAIVGRPEILLYDEPVTGLDPVNAAAVDRLIKDIGEKTQVTSIVVTHDIEGGLLLADRVALLEGGKLRFVGSPQEFRSSPDPLVRAFADRDAAAAAAAMM